MPQSPRGKETLLNRQMLCPSGVPVRALVVLGVLSAQVAGDGFTWEAPSTCPDAADVRARIERRLGRSLDDLAVGIAVDIAVEPTGYVARIDARAATVDHVVRTLTSTRCDELTDAVALIVARLATESRRVAVVVRPAAPEITEAVAAPPRPRRWGGGIRVLGLSGIGRVPSVGLGGELAGSVRRHDVFGEIAASHWVGRPLRISDGAPGIDVSLDAATLRMGWSPDQMPLRAWLAGEFGTIRGSGLPEIGSARWVSAGAGFGVAWPMSPEIRLVGTFELAVPFSRPYLQLESGDRLYQPSWLTAQTSIGLEIGWR
jgi:hypothetical protein